ncbi:MAG TPA: hypothetical protein VL769_11965 [Acidimicrobiia bacterium]|jgi:hypothetical protein|nr:hypothetical protein [Acidimicrobiia bacterium]
MSSRADVGAEMPIGERFVRAIAARDRRGLLDLLAPHIDFRAMTPGRFWEASSAAEVVDEVILGHWFAPTDRIEAIESIEHDVVVDRERVGYRFRVSNADGEYAVEQQAYLGAQNDVIGWLRIMCAGYQSVG